MARHVQEQGDDLWIEVAPDVGAPQVDLILNRSAEEPSGGCLLRFKSAIPGPE